MIATSRAVGGDEEERECKESEEDVDVFDDVCASLCADVGGSGRSLCVRMGY